MKRPSLQFYPADWRNNANLRRCSWDARGVWIEVMCLMHDSGEYGVLRWSLKEISQAIGAPLRTLKQLAEKHVLKGADDFNGTFQHAPTHARKLGEPVTLITSSGGPCWYSSRLVIDEWRRTVQGAGTRFGASDAAPTARDGARLGAAPSARQSDGATASASASASASSSSCNSLASTIDPSAGQLAERACALMVEAGCKQSNPSHPDLIAAIAEGVTPQALADTAREAIAKGRKNPFAWAIATARNRQADGPTARGGKAKPVPASFEPFVSKGPRRPAVIEAPKEFTEIAKRMGIGRSTTT
jgi:hypothetical protein